MMHPAGPLLEKREKGRTPSCFAQWSETNPRSPLKCPPRRQLRAAACTVAKNLRPMLTQRSEVQVFVAGEIVRHTEDSRRFLHRCLRVAEVERKLQCHH